MPFERRAARPFRAMFLAVFLLVGIATHWPQLSMPAQVPGSDKVVHLLVFGGLLILFWRSRWTRSRMLAVVIVAAWSVVDEASQALPGINRHATVRDAMANVMGVLVAGLWLFALGPVGSARHRLRLALSGMALDRAFLSAGLWMRLAFTAALAALPVPILLSAVPAAQARPILLGIGGVVMIVLHALIWSAWVRTIAVAQQVAPCLHCGAVPPRTTAVDGRAAPFDRCEACGGPAGDALWSMLRVPARPAILRAAGRSLLVVLGGALVLLAAALLLPLLYGAALGRPGSGGATAFMRWMTGGAGPLSGDPTFLQAIDLAIVLVLGAIAVRVYRHALARLVDRGEICLVCGHDLRGTPVTAPGGPAPAGGIGSPARGVCGECGTAFTREAPEPGSA
ncbi:MAG: VanZ family protein [Phycisphaeraceae bacterium]|nr:VanZ family protein [Phycisphaeraceae bacterium]